jgi:hypothetical protein
MASQSWVSFRDLSCLLATPSLFYTKDTCLGTVKAWSLKLASMIYARFLGHPVVIWSACEVMDDVLLQLTSKRAGKIPSMGMCAGSTHTSRGSSCFSLNYNLSPFVGSYEPWLYFSSIKLAKLYLV